MSWLAQWFRRARTAAFGQQEIEDGPDALHWSALQDGLPYCGADLRGARWTIEPEAATCKKCREDAALVVLNHRLGNR